MSKPKTLNINKKNTASYNPQPTYQRTKLSYFVHSDQVHSVAKCSAETFRDAVLALMPQWLDNATYGPLVASPDMLVDRWFILVALAEEARRPMRLFAFRADAERALQTTANTR